MFKIISVLVLLSTPVYAQTYNHYGNNGIRTGDTVINKNDITYHNEMGIVTGRAKIDGNEIKHYNAQGIYQGSTKRQ